VPTGPLAGEPIRLAGFQKRFIRGALKRDTSIALLSGGRGGGKTRLSAGLALGGLEFRRAPGGAVRLRGSFPYGKRATIGADGNGRRPRKEVFGPRAFSFALEEDREVHFLVGHSFDKPLASLRAGTLDLTDTDEALVMEADLTPEIQAATWVRTSLPGCGPGSSWACRPAFAAPASRPR